MLLRVQPDAQERLQQQRAELRALVAASVDGLHTDDVVLVLDPVTVQTPVIPIAIDAPAPSENGMRAMVVVLGLVLAVLASALIIIFFRLRKKESNAQPPAPVAVPKPVISANVQRKVA